MDEDLLQQQQHKHNELLIQKQTELRGLEEQIFKSQQILQQQLQPGKAKRQKLDNTMKTTSLEFSSPLPDNNSPISGVVDQPLLELANYQQATDDNTERESEKSSRL